MLFSASVGLLIAPIFFSFLAKNADHLFHTDLGKVLVILPNLAMNLSQIQTKLLCKSVDNIQTIVCAFLFCLNLFTLVLLYCFVCTSALVFYWQFKAAITDLFLFFRPLGSAE